MPIVRGAIRLLLTLSLAAGSAGYLGAEGRVTLADRGPAWSIANSAPAASAALVRMGRTVGANERAQNQAPRTPADAARSLALGGVVSFAGNISYKNAQELRDACAVVPLDRLLVETDSPYLAPVPHRGRPNEPAFVPAVGAAVSAATGVSVEEIAAATSTNAALIFGWL